MSASSAAGPSSTAIASSSTLPPPPPASSSTPAAPVYPPPKPTPQENENDKKVMAIWTEHVVPLKPYYEENFSEERWDAALSTFFAQTRAAELDTDGFFTRAGTDLPSVKARYAKGPVLSARPGYRTPYLGQEFPLADLLPHLSLFDVDAATGSVSEDAPWEWNEPDQDAPQRVTLVEFWASWCDGCVEAFPIFSLLQKTYHPLLQILAVNSEHIFHQPSRGPMPDATLTREVVMEFVKERAKDQVGGLGFSVFEDSKGVVTDGIFHRVAVPYIPNAFIFIGSRLFYQGEPELADDSPEGFISQVEAAVGIAGGVREPPAWFAKAIADDAVRGRASPESISSSGAESEAERPTDENVPPTPSTPSTSIGLPASPSSSQPSGVGLEEATSSLSLGK